MRNFIHQIGKQVSQVFLLTLLLAESAPILPAVAAGGAALAPPASSSSAASPVRIADDRGRIFLLSRPARRVVSLAPNITELVFAAGAGTSLVGVSRYSDYPESARFLPDVGDASSLDLERILALRPDLVIGWGSGTARSSIEKLEKLGLPVFVIDPVKLSDISRLLRTMGLLTGTVPQAEEVAHAYEDQLEEIKRSHASRIKVRTVSLIWHQPLMTVNGHHVISDIIRLCGGVNVFASSLFLAPVISEEDLLIADPEAIISSVMPGGVEIAPAMLLRRLPRVTAIRNNQLFFIHPDLILRPSIRLLLGATQLCGQLERVRSKPG